MTQSVLRPQKKELVCDLNKPLPVIVHCVIDAKHLMIRRVQGIVNRAEVRPSLWTVISFMIMPYISMPLTGNRVDGRNVRNVLSKDDGEAGLEMPVNVAVKEPGTRVVGLQVSPTVSQSHHGSVKRLTSNRIVTLSPVLPMLTTSRWTGLT